MRGTMPDIDRRQFVGTGALGLIGLLPGSTAGAQGPAQPAASSGGPSEVTRLLTAEVARR